MKPINSHLLELIETELAQTNSSNYYKSISINEYSLETKLTLDLLIEKYGGCIYRYDNRVTILINFSNYSPKNQKKINSDFYKKLINLEEKINRIYQMIEKMNQEKEKSYFSYMNYFKQIEMIKNSKNNMNQLVQDVMKEK